MTTTVQTSTRNATLKDLAALLQDQHARKLDIVAPATSIHAEAGRLVITGAAPVVEVDADGIPEGTPTRSGATILDHFVRGGQLTAGGIMQAVTSTAQTVDDPDRAHELESSALRALDLAAVTR